MLKGISPLLSPELLKILSEMGHGDELVIADRNFPSVSICNRVIRADASDGACRTDGGLPGRYGCSACLGHLS